MHQQALQNVRVTPQVHPPHAARFIRMRERPLHTLATTPQQATAPLAPNPPPVPVHRVPRLRVVLPGAPAPVRFRNVTPNPHRSQTHQRLVAVVALVPNHLRNARPLRQHRLHLLRRRNRRLHHRLRIALLRTLKRQTNHRPRSQVDSMLHLVGHVRAAVLHLRDLRVRVVRMRPLLVRHLLLPLPVKTRQLLRRRRFDAGRLRQSRQERPVVLSRVPPHDRPHRRVRFQRRRVDAQRLPLNQSRVRQLLQHPREHRLVGLQRKQTPRPRDRRMVRRRGRRRQEQKRPHTQRIRRPPSNRTLRVQPLEVPEQ